MRGIQPLAAFLPSKLHAWMLPPNGIISCAATGHLRDGSSGTGEALSPSCPLIPRERAALSLIAESAGQCCLAPAPGRGAGDPRTVTLAKDRIRRSVRGGCLLRRDSGLEAALSSPPPLGDWEYQRERASLSETKSHTRLSIPQATRAIKSESAPGPALPTSRSWRQGQGKALIYFPRR